MTNERIRYPQLLQRLTLCIAYTFFFSIQTNATSLRNDPARLLQQGQSFASSGRLLEAEDTLSSALSMAPENINILTLLAEVKARLGEREEAIVLFKKIIMLEPKSSSAHLNLAITLADTSNTDAAIGEVERAIQIDPRNARAHLNLARMLADVRRVTDARKEFIRASQLCPNDSDIELFWAIFEKDNHRLSVAGDLLTKVVAEQTDNAKAYFLLGQVDEALGKTDDAISAFRRALELDRSSQNTVYALFQALRQKNSSEAEGFLRQFNYLRAAEQQIDRARVLGNQAYAQMQQQNWSSAVQTLIEALGICGHCVLEAELHQRLGLAECHNGDLDTGEREIRTALSLNPNDRTSRDALNWIAVQRKELTLPR